MTKDSEMAGNGLRAVLDQVDQRLPDSEARSLWERILEEMQEGGPAAMTQYVEDELLQLKQEFEKQMHRLDDELTGREV